MKFALVALLLCCSAACAVGTVESQRRADNTAPAGGPQPAAKRPVLIELFTSEGCSSCPAADRALALLDTEQPYPQAELVTLALHVDYWDGPEWKDAFSSPQFTARQREYQRRLGVAQSYTPQMIVDGRTEFVGSDLGRAARAITAAAAAPKARVELAAAGEKLKIVIADAPPHENATVFLAVAEDGLTTRVAGGENAGRLLEHRSVARVLKPVGKLAAGAAAAEFEIAAPVVAGAARGALKYVVFVQENETRRIIGAARRAVDPK